MLWKRLWKRLVVLGTLAVLGCTSLASAQHGVYYNYKSPGVQTGSVQVTQSAPQAILLRLMQANGIPESRLQGIELVNESKTLNAYTDGKKIYMTTGLWNTLQTDDQRAFTIAHELSHVALNHVPKTQARRFGLSLLNQFLARKLSSDNALVNLVRVGGVNMVEMKFSRNAEYGADDLGLQFMKKAGYNPMAALEVFEVFEKNTRATSRSPEFLRDHPLNKSRIATLAKKYQMGSTTAAFQPY